MESDKALSSEMHNMYLRQKIRYVTVFVFLVVSLCIIVCLNIRIGSVSIEGTDLVDILFRKKGDDTLVSIVWEIRLPRIIMAVILGGALSLSGFLLQTFFGNPIVGPYVLGISSGAKLMVSLTLIFYLQCVGSLSSFVMIIAAFVGAMISMGFVLLLSKRIHTMSVLLVGGIMIGYICSAITDFVVTFAEESDIVNLHGWSLGSFSGMTWENVKVAGIVVAVCAIAVVLLSKPIGAYQLGENYAQSVGVNIRRFRVLLILLSSILAACVTAFAGPISFVGIAVPHLVKRSLNTAKPLIVIPATFLGGAVFCTFCDLIARKAFAPTELNISTVTAVFGAPVVIGMMLRRSGR